MMNGKGSRPSPALLVALAALVFAMSGAAIAAPRVMTKDIKNGAVTTKKLKRQAVTAGKLAPGAVKTGKLADAAVTGEKVKDGSLSDRELSDFEVFGDSTVRVAATDGSDPTVARVAAPKVRLASKGVLSLYGKCFRDLGSNTVHGAIYIETGVPGAIFDSANGDRKEGGDLAADFLNPDTPEVDREIATKEVTGTGAAFGHGDDDAWRAFAPDGTSLTGLFAVAVKNGSLASGNGVYGSGNVCLLGGNALG